MTEVSLAALAEMKEPPEVPTSASLKEAPLELRLALLKELGIALDKDGVHLLNQNGTKVLDPYVNEWVRVDHFLILPGSIMILDDNLVSVACYMEEHGDAL
jgi:hypothetical protein